MMIILKLLFTRYMQLDPASDELKEIAYLLIRKLRDPLDWSISQFRKQSSFTYCEIFSSRRFVQKIKPLLAA